MSSTNEVISSKENKNFKYLKSLKNKKFRNRDGVFFIEGEVVFTESLKYESPIYIAIDEDYEISDEFENFEVKRFSNSLFKDLSDTENSQGIIGYYRQIDRDISEIKAGSYLYLDDLRDPGNVGGLIRSADGFKMDGVILSSSTVDIYNPKLIRSTMASIFRIPIYILNEKNEILKLRGRGFQIISAIMNSENSSYDFKFPKNTILALGNEANGISEYILENSDSTISIPISSELESLNVNVAGSILMYEMRR